MKLKTFWTLVAVVGVLFGFANLFLPAKLLAFYVPAEQINPALIEIERLLGAALIGLSLMEWMMRDAPLSIARRAALAGVAMFNILGMIASLIGVLDGTTNAMGWSSVFIFLAFGIGATYFFLQDHKAITERDMREKVAA